MTRKLLIAANSSWNILHFRGALIQTLKSEGYSVISTAPDDAYTARMKALVDQHIALPIESDGTSPLRDLALLLRYVRLLRKLRPAAMLTYTIKPNIYGCIAARMAGVPVIANVSGLGTAFIRKNWLTWVVQQLYRIAFHRVALVFFQNPEDRELFVRLKLVAPEKTLLIPGSGVNLTYYAPSQTPREASRPLAFVLIARMLWDKGVGEYVAAASIVKARHPDVVFHLVGPSGSKNKTAIPEAQLACWDSEDSVQYLGVSEDVRHVISEHDCVVLPSYREGLSRVLLEAAAMGKPLIATDVAGCRQVVTHQSNGLLCKPQDAQDLAASMLHFITLSPEQRAVMGINSREQAEREFDEKYIFEAYLAAIKSVSRY